MLAAGATVQLIPIQKELAAKDVVARMEQAGTKLLVTDDVLHAMATEATQELPRITIYVPAEDEKLFRAEMPAYHSFSLNGADAAESTVGFLNRTSGSTGGKMKTVITTHAHFIATMEGTLHTVPQNTDPDPDVWLSTLSLGFFINAKLNLGLNILLGISVVLMDSPFGPQKYDVIERHKIKFLFIPPPVAFSIAASQTETLKDVDISSVKWLLSAGAAMHEGLQQAVSKKLNNAHLDLEWGTSETLLIAIQMDGHLSPPSSSGRLVNGIEALVINTETGKPVGPGDDGEILVRNSGARFAGYKSDQAANQSTFDMDGWFHSGDYGHIDENNNVFIMDRIKELIRIGSSYGVYVSATDIEAILFEHSAIAEVIVTGIPDPKAGMERPTAFVILSLDWRTRQEEALRSLQAFAKKNLTGLQMLKGGFFFLSRFPLIGFKINRRALKAIAVKDTAVDQGFKGPRLDEAVAVRCLDARP